MPKGLYKVEMHTVHGSRRGVLYVYDGKMMGGNSAFAFVGTYQESGSSEVSVDISTMRHNDDANFQPLRCCGGWRRRKRSDPPVHREQSAGDGAGGVAYEKQDHVGQLLRRHPFCEIRLRHAGTIG